MPVQYILLRIGQQRILALGSVRNGNLVIQISIFSFWLDSQLAWALLLYLSVLKLGQEVKLTYGFLGLEILIVDHDSLSQKRDQSGRQVSNLTEKIKPRVCVLVTANPTVHSFMAWVRPGFNVGLGLAHHRFNPHFPSPVLLNKGLLLLIRIFSLVKLGLASGVVLLELYSDFTSRVVLGPRRSISWLGTDSKVYGIVFSLGIIPDIHLSPRLRAAPGIELYKVPNGILDFNLVHTARASSACERVDRLKLSFISNIYSFRQSELELFKQVELLVFFCVVEDRLGLLQNRQQVVKSVCGSAALTRRIQASLQTVNHYD